MDISQSESDVSMSPTQILQRLHVLKQLQLLQRGKLQKQRLEYQQGSEESASVTEIVSQFSSSSYNTFQSLLQFSGEKSDLNQISRKVKQKDLIDGVSVLNLSQESEFLINSDISSKQSSVSEKNCSSKESHRSKKLIELDEMPIIGTKQDFETLVMNQIQKDQTVPSKTMEILKSDKTNVASKKMFLRRGEGMSRFGLNKQNLVIQNTKSLPWRKRTVGTTRNPDVKKINKKDIKVKQPKLIERISIDKVRDEAQVSETKHDKNCELLATEYSNNVNKQKSPNNLGDNKLNNNNKLQEKSEFKIPNHKLSKDLQKVANKHPLVSNKGKTWASILTSEQDEFLKQLKQSDYYKNFNSPAKSTISDISCDDNVQMSLERETVEQNLFDLLENKVSQGNFNIENSFFTRFLKRNLECSGESTPLVFKKCLSTDPNLLHIYPPPEGSHCRVYDGTQSEMRCDSEYTDCDHETCSSVSTCCSCKTVEETQTPSRFHEKPVNSNKNINNKNKDIQNEKAPKNDDIDTDRDEVKANMAEMNAKLVATSDLLKERLKELEDEIETFRKENANLIKIREEIDLERQRFYEEKSNFEQKFNEEKILSDYYLAEEKEKLSKQKQLYERHVREIRGRLNKKEKDEMVLLKNQISDLKEEIRLKDAKATTTMARLRNQIKILEKDKKDLDIECEKLKKENRRIKHTNETTRRLSNIKYIEEINRKLSAMSSRETKSDIVLDNDVKYKSYEMEHQNRTLKHVDNKSLRRRTKSVPNLNVTSRYAKYFSQRDALSQYDKNNIETVSRFNTQNEYNNNTGLNLDDTDESIKDIDISDAEEVNNPLEKIYTDRFKSRTPDNEEITTKMHNNSDHSLPSTSRSSVEKLDTFFLQKSASNNTISTAKSVSRSISPYNQSSDVLRSKSPASILTNRTSSHRSPTVIEAPTPESSINKSNASKVTLNPTEVRRTDGVRELRFPNGNIKYISPDGRYQKFLYYNGDVKETFLDEGRIKYFYAENKTYHTTHPDGLEVLEFPDGQIEKRYKDGSTEIRLQNGAVRYTDPKNPDVQEEWRLPDGAVLTVTAAGEQRVRFVNGQVEVHAKDHKRREYPDGTVKLIYSDGTSETRYASGRIRVKDRLGNLILDSAPG